MASTTPQASGKDTLAQVSKDGELKRKDPIFRHHIAPGSEFEPESMCLQSLTSVGRLSLLLSVQATSPHAGQFAKLMTYLPQ